MFRPNRIGTPVIFETAATVSTDNTALNQNTIVTAITLGNVVNATPRLDFGHHALRWTPGTPQALTAGNKWAFGLQFTVTEPLEGDVVGIECNGSCRFYYGSQSAVFTPVFAKLVAAGATTLAAVQLDYPTGMGKPYMERQAAGTQIVSMAYQEDVIARGEPGSIAGTYFHGFLVASSHNMSVSSLATEFSVRQLNDQQSIGYRDTLR